MNSLVLDAGSYSLDQESIGGIGLRVAELAAALAHHFSVFVYSPATGAREPVDVGAAELVTDEHDWRGLLADAQAVFFFDMPDAARIEDARDAGVVIVSENTPPIEQLEYPRLRRDGIFDTRAYQHLVDTYRKQLTCSDLFIARSDVERTTLIANLCAYGLLSVEDLARSRQLDHRITTVPIGYSTTTAAPAAPRPTAAPAAGPREVLWTGGLWAFMNPVAAVRAVAVARAAGVEITLRFLHAAPHPDTAAARAEISDVAAGLGITDHVVLHADPMRHDDRDHYLRHAAGLICLARPGIENRTCVRLRVRDSRLHGLPLLVDPFGATATELGADGLAVAVDPDDIGAIADHLAGLVCERAPRSAAARQWAYEHTLAPLITNLTTRLDN